MGWARSVRGRGAAGRFELTSDEGTLGPAGTRFEDARCRANKKGTFLATGRSTAGGFVFAFQMADFRGFDKNYKITYGVLVRSFTVEAVGAAEGSQSDFDSAYTPPGVPPRTRSGGGASFSKNGKRLSIGFTPLYNSDYSRAVAAVPEGGGVKCRYPR